MSTEIVRLHLEYLMARRKLRAAVQRECPGKHYPVQHRDSMPPWCNACGRTANGVLIKEPT